jgi:hypothetical protein
MGTEAYMKIFMMPSSSTTPQEQKQLKASEENAGQKIKEEEVENMAATLISNPMFGEIRPDDSDELAKAKADYKEAELNDDAARAGKAEAARRLRVAKMNYDNSPGLVGKIDTKWEMIDAENQYKAALVKAEEAEKEKKKKAFAGAEQILTEDTDSGLEEDHGATKDSSKEKLVLRYVPEVHLPNGDEGNPFVDDRVAHRARTGPDRSIQAARKFSRLANSLKQPALAISAAPVPEIEEVDPSKEGRPPTPPPPAQVVIKVPVPAGSVKKARVLARDLTEALVDGIDGQYERVSIAESRRIAL